MKIQLRPVDLKDGRTIVNWRNDTLVREHCRTHTPITEEVNEGFYHNFVETGKYKQYIVEKIDEEYGVFSYAIATIYLKDVDYNNKSAELCLFTSNDREWNAESQVLAIDKILEIAFNELNLQTVYSYTFKKFLKEAEILSPFGFVMESSYNKDDLVKYTLDFQQWNNKSDGELI